jgi:hypothetical protein
MLDAIARDIDQHPDVLRPVDAKLAGRCRALSAGLDVDLDVPLPRELGDAGMPCSVATATGLANHNRPPLLIRHGED